jgi:hypothetical protein
MLASWKICKDRNAHVYHNQSITSTMLVSKLKNEVSMWFLVGAKAWSSVGNAARVGFFVGLGLWPILLCKTYKLVLDQ